MRSYQLFCSINSHQTYTFCSSFLLAFLVYYSIKLPLDFKKATFGLCQFRIFKHMGYESSSPSHVGHDEDDDDEYEEGAGGNRLLGFMFGNVDGSGDLDVDYLDEDAKEHLSALVDKLGSSLTEIDLSVQLPHTTTDTADQGEY
ncbi:transcription initiation factor TFIID subunit 1-like [Olea europaea var. sylvestris]|uniref:transcription initiation factor TFIID subunit 1-like n=1 Tax=Olea europaea var. sylvestris TaxID=158386 RepID=UPI000C1D0C03|nr:transcription initiation factor TFIID subunit 1-like [Olea europaea var. sylvestris]